MVQGLDQLNLSASRGVAVPEFQSQGGPADYVLLVVGKALGVVEAKKAGFTFSSIAEQHQIVSAVEARTTGIEHLEAQIQLPNHPIQPPRPICSGRSILQPTLNFQNDHSLI